MNENPNAVTVLEAPPAPSTFERPPEPAPPTRFGRLLHTLPTVVVLAALGGLAYWGHHTGWTMPTFAALTGNGATADKDWCSDHSVPESRCVECNPTLLPRGKEYGWCKVHGVAECPLEHPDVAQLKKTPQVTPDDLTRARKALAFTPRTENNSKCKLHLRRVQFASQEAFDKAGVAVEPAWEAPMTEVVSANGEITYDQTRVARLSARVPGTVWFVAKQVGDAVRRGEILALVDAAEVGKAKTEFLQAAVQVELKTRTLAGLLKAGSAIPERQLQEADAAFQEAQIRLTSAEQALINLGLPVRAEDMRGLGSDAIRRRLQFLGLPEDVVKAFDSRTGTSNLLPLVSPLDGVVVAREVVAGEVVDIAKALFVVADVRQMWLTLSLRLEDAQRVAVGLPVRFHADGVSEEVNGTVAWLSTAVDEKTRTVKVRADLPNRDGRLRANTFGRGRVILREEPKAVVVPNEAVHWEGDCHIVFVRDKDYDPQKADSLLVFHTRKVRPGARNAQYTEIIAGVLPNEVVAAKGSGTLRTALLKNNLGES